MVQDDKSVAALHGIGEHRKGWCIVRVNGDDGSEHARIGPIDPLIQHLHHEDLAGSGFREKLSAPFSEDV